MQYTTVKQLILTATLLVVFSGALYAEQITVPVGRQAAEKQAVERPKNGMNKDQVQAQYGEPTGLSDPIGEPPISSWEYEDFIVYFEYDKVLHSVLKRD